jgi:4-hydroxybenzoate polyprenyltransferase
MTRADALAALSKRDAMCLYAGEASAYYGPRSEGYPMEAAESRDATVPDAPKGNWVGRFLPAAARPYARLARLDRPIGWWLLLWPCWWSSALATNSLEFQYPDLGQLLLFLVGAIVMRGAGCTYNDIVDRHIDARVERTRLRPIPSGQVSVAGAIVFLIVQLLIGLFVLIQFGTFTILLGLASVGTIVIYPFLKRFTNWPQVGLGLAFSWGALMGWSGLLDDLHPASILLYVGSFFWVIGYDTIYASQDKEDDALAGVHSTALLFGKRANILIGVCYALATAFFAASFSFAEVELVSYVGLALGAAHLAWQVATLDTENPERCLKLFRSNRDFGWIIFLGIIIDGWLTGW